MKYAKRDTALVGMPKLTKYETVYRAQRRAINAIARKTVESRTIDPDLSELPYTDQISPYET